MKTYAEWFRRPSVWWLMHKESGHPVLSVKINEGDQAYYTKRHVGDVISAREIVCYGLGKKTAEGTPVNLWLLPNGTVCGGEDVDHFAVKMLRIG